MPAANHAHKHQLKPCPFCGSTDLTLDNLADPKHGWYVNCNICEIQQIANYTEGQAVALWNRRASPPRFVVEPSRLNSWLVLDVGPGRLQRSNWAVKAEAEAEAARLEASPNSFST